MARARRLQNLALAGLLLSLATMSAAALATEPPPLQCALKMPASVTAGQPAPLSLTLTNRSRAGLHVLVWGTPFEGWFAPFIAVWRNGAKLPYRGPTVKRADPERDEYLDIAPGEARSASVNLAEPFDLRQPGRYRVEARIVLHDVIASGQATPPRTREQHARLPLGCGAVEFQVRSAPH